MFDRGNLASSPGDALEILNILVDIADAARLSDNRARAVEAISAARAYIDDLEARSMG